MEPVLSHRNRVLTVPNMLSVIRLFHPSIHYVVLSAHCMAEIPGSVVFRTGADGKIARLLNRIGAGRAAGPGRYGHCSYRVWPGGTMPWWFVTRC